MKAHIVTEPRCVLLWNFGPACAGYDALRRAAHDYRLTVREVDEEALDTQIAALCAGRALSPAPAPAGNTAAPTARAAMIVSGLQHDNGDLNGFVEAVKKGGAELPLRAMVTPTSRGWTLRALLAELCAEHETLNAGENA